MAKKQKEMKMPEKQTKQIQDLAAKIDDAIAEMNIPADDELEIFAESVALLINHWGRTSGWTPLEHISYASYVILTFMEKGVTAEIDKLDTFIKKRMKAQEPTMNETN